MGRPRASKLLRLATTRAQAALEVARPDTLLPSKYPQGGLLLEARRAAAVASRS